MDAWILPAGTCSHQARAGISGEQSGQLSKEKLALGSLVPQSSRAMTLKQLVEQAAAQRGVRIAETPDGIPGWLAKAKEHPDVEVYFAELLPERAYYVAGADLHSVDEVEGEINKRSWPGGIVYPYGYISFAKTLEGHQICVSVEDGSVRFSDRSRLTDEHIHLRTTDDDREEVPLSAENLRVGMPIIARDLNDFFQGIVDGSLEGPLDHLDSYGYLPEG